MRIVLITDAKSCVAGFDTISRSKTHDVEVAPPHRLKHVIKSMEGDSFLYVDVTGLSIASVRSRLKTLSEEIGSRYGIIDRDGTVTDVAEVFHRGAADYVDARLLSKKVSVSRFSRVLETTATVIERRPEDAAKDPDNIRPSGTDWIGIDDGGEYTFQMLYVGLDYGKEIRRKSSDELIRSVRKNLQNILTDGFSSIHGRIWLWKEDEGVLLCPFDGGRVTSLVPTVRLVLNRALINEEQFNQTTPISWRMGLHIGNTTYRAGQTGAIVSESLNLIFHLGQRALGPGQFAVTDSVMRYLTERARECFAEGPVFESTRLFFFRDLA